MDPLLQPRKRVPRRSGSAALESANDGVEKTRRKPLLRLIGSGFRYNGRVALAMAPGLLAMLLHGGSPVMAALFCTLFVIYLLDLFDLAHAAFLAVWCGMGVVNLFMFYQGIALVRYSYFNLFTVGLYSLSVMVFTSWMSLQFRFLQETSASAMILLERLVMNLVPALYSMIVTYTAVSIVGVMHGPFILLAMLCWTQYLLNQPLASCFRPSENQLICNVKEMVAHSLSLLVLPVLFHCALFHRNFFIQFHLVNLLALISFSMLFFALTERFTLLTEFGVDSRTAKRFSKIAMMASGIALVFAFESRVVFGSYYYAIPLPPPWNYALVTVACYLGAFLAYLFVVGEAKTLGQPVCTAIACVGAFAAGCILGMSWITLPLIVAAAIMLVSFYFTRKAIDYILFASLSSLVSLWFVYRSFWFLQFDFDGFSMQFVSLVLVGLLVLTFFVPANVFAPQRGAILALYAFSLSVVESIVHLHSIEVYPYYAVVFTSILGAGLTWHLEKHHYINHFTSWFCYSSFLSKLILGVAYLRVNTFAALALTLVVLAPYYCHTHLSVRTGLIYAAASGIIAFATTNLVGGALLVALVDGLPTTNMMIAVFLLTWGVNCVALATIHFPDSVLARRLSSTVVIASLGMMMLDPHSGFFVSVGNQTPVYLIIAVVLFLVCARSRYPAVRYFFVVAMGATCSALLVQTTLPSAQSFYVLFALIFMSFFALINWLSFPSQNGIKMLPFVFIFFLALLPAALSLGSLTVSGFPGHVSNLYLRQLRSALIGLYGGLSILLALFIKTKVSGGYQTAGGHKRATKMRPGAKTDSPWLAEMGNTSIILGYIVSIYFCTYSLDLASTAVFLLSPLLLLLNTDRYFFTWLREENRYLPVVACCTLSFFTISLYNILHLALIRQKWRMLLFKEILFLLAALPSNYLFLLFLSSWKRQPALWWMIVAPLNLIGLFAAFPTTLWLSIEGICLSIAYAVAVLVLQRKSPSL